MKNIIEKLSPNLTVITGANGSGKTRLLNQLKEQNLNAEFIDDCGCTLDHNALINYAKILKENSKHRQYIVASTQKEIIDVADKLIICHEMT